MQNITVGQTYTINGSITNIIDESNVNNIKCEINHNMIGHVIAGSENQLELLKSRAFDPCILNFTVQALYPKITVKCNSIVFGKGKKFYDC